jgi:hypothetical protein
MHDFYRAFSRNADGSWTCVAPATLVHPRGRIQVAEGACFHPGVIFMGVDVAAWLEEQHEDLRAAANCAPGAVAGAAAAVDRRSDPRA